MHAGEVQVQVISTPITCSPPHCLLLHQQTQPFIVRTCVELTPMVCDEDQLGKVPEMCPVC